jgi:hypothetical protein
MKLKQPTKNRRRSAQPWATLWLAAALAAVTGRTYFDNLTCTEAGK